MVLRPLSAVVVFVLFGGLSFLMGRSTLRDLKAHHDERDWWGIAIDLHEFGPTVMAALIAVVVPLVILLAV